MGGMITSSTSDLTIVPKAAPMMMPTATSTMLPLTANPLDSSDASASVYDKQLN